MFPWWPSSCLLGRCPSQPRLRWTLALPESFLPQGNCWWKPNLCDQAVGRGVHFLPFLVHLRGLPLLQTHTVYIPPCLLTLKNRSSKRLLGTVSWIWVSHRNMGQDAEKGMGILAPIHFHSQRTLKTINIPSDLWWKEKQAASLPGRPRKSPLPPHAMFLKR